MMASIALGDRARGAAFIAGSLLRQARAQLYLSPFYRWRFAGRSSDRLLLAPQDIRTSDPTIGNDIYEGHFSLAGQTASTEGASIFSIIPPSPEWRRALLSFGWLRHLRATNSAVARSQSRALIEDWIVTEGRWRGMSWEAEVTARRVISWLSHSPLILDGANRAYYRRFIKSLNRQVRYLRRAAASTPDGLPRLTAVIALNYAGLCMAGHDRLQRKAAAWLDAELARQILADGGHASRNPGVLVELLLDLLPLRQTFTARDIPPPAALLNAVDRMMPMIRFFRHGDGAFALFNGMSGSRADAIATVLAYDDTFGKPIDNAIHSGYQRLAADSSVVLMDTGGAPPLAMSTDAHAGCLSLEFSSGRHRIIVNCGKPAAVGRAWRQAARTTAAHSTATVDDTSSCRFLLKESMSRNAGVAILSGPNVITVDRREGADGIEVTADHDGYRHRFGLLHRRQVRLSADGRELAGEDEFEAAPRANPENAPYALRFHLHPDVAADIVEPGHGVLLNLPNGESWAFAVEGGKPELEDSVYLPDPDGPRRTKQIVVYGRAGHQPRIAWTMQRVRAAREPVRYAPVAEPAD